MELLKRPAVVLADDLRPGGERDTLRRKRAVGVAGVLASGLVAMTFARPRIQGDGLVYYAFMRKLLGENVKGAFAYQPGLAYWNAPFYLVGRAIGKPEVSIAVASYVACLLTLFLARRLLIGLGLPYGWVLLAVALIGTPLWYYVLFEPSYTHVLDGLVFTAAATALGAALRVGRGRWAVAAGACAGFLPSVRYANVFVVPFLIAPLILRNRRLGSIACVSALTAGMLAFAVPILAGVHYGKPDSSTVSIDPTAPFKMLFSVQRGLFLWTPLTFVTVVGYLAWLRRDPLNRSFLVSVGGGGLALVVGYAGWGNLWPAGFSFSERYLASLFPIFVIGAAAIVRLYSWRGIALIAGTSCVSLVIGFTFAYGYKGQNAANGVDTILRLYVNGDRTLPGIARQVGVHARDRWETIFADGTP